MSYTKILRLLDRSFTLFSDGTAVTALRHGTARQERSCPVLEEAALQLCQYASGTRRQFTVPLAPSGTDFQQAVWAALQTIPYGETRSYGEIAAQIGKPTAARAVGMACNQNPILLLIPCHRVIGKSGSLTGYAAGLDLKEELLNLEKRTL